MAALNELSTPPDMPTYTCFFLLISELVYQKRELKRSLTALNLVSQALQLVLLAKPKS